MIARFWNWAKAKRQERKAAWIIYKALIRR